MPRAHVIIVARRPRRPIDKLLVGPVETDPALDALPAVRRTPGISCEAVTASMPLAGAGMRRHVHSGNHAAESFVSFIPLFGGTALAFRSVKCYFARLTKYVTWRSPGVKVSAPTPRPMWRTRSHAVGGTTISRVTVSIVDTER